MKKSNVQNQDLLYAIEEMERGLIDAYLGGSIYKKRVGLQGVGKRSGGRVILATQFMKRWFLCMDFLRIENPI